MCGCMYMSVCLQDGSPNPTLEAGTIISPILLLGKLRLQLVKNLSLKCLSLVYQIPKPSLAHPVGGAELMHRQPLPPPPPPPPPTGSLSSYITGGLCPGISTWKPALVTCAKQRDECREKHHQSFL